MDDHRDPVLIFLADMGIEGNLLISSDGDRRIAIPTEQYKQHQQWVETWFRLIDQHEDFAYFHERLRGTGDTL